MRHAEQHARSRTQERRRRLAVEGAAGSQPVVEGPGGFLRGGRGSIVRGDVEGFLPGEQGRLAFRHGRCQQLVAAFPRARGAQQHRGQEGQQQCGSGGCTPQSRRQAFHLGAGSGFRIGAGRGQRQRWAGTPAADAGQSAILLEKAMDRLPALRRPHRALPALVGDALGRGRGAAAPDDRRDARVEQRLVLRLHRHRRHGPPRRRGRAAGQDGDRTLAARVHRRRRRTRGRRCGIASSVPRPCPSWAVPSAICGRAASGA